MSSIISQFLSVYKDLVHLHSLIQKVKYKQRELSWSYFILSGCKTIFFYENCTEEIFKTSEDKTS